ncbi:hypothetical protein Syun_003000 [Stephania yunnanensis]|uniref:E3 ubiquitin-protein ligase RNF170 n=1 Tax=Stephania yunnanensis TaxID=152371 RepID=A0AAP0PZS5_9MAGN
MATDEPPANDYCSVCHEQFNQPCQANCSHWFCGNCIMSVWHHGPALQPCKCPLCRRLITLLIPSQSMTGARDNSEVNGILLEIERYNRRFGGGSLTLLQILVSVIYVLSPIDIIPEGVLGFIGFVDDILVALFFFLHIAAIYRAVLLNRHGGY